MNRRVGPDMAGCWFDGARGHAEVGMAVIREARDRGWNMPESASVGPEDDDFDEWVDDAVAYLNDEVAPIGHSFVFREGDFMLQEDEPC